MFPSTRKFHNVIRSSSLLVIVVLVLVAMLVSDPVFLFLVQSAVLPISTMPVILL